MSFLVPLQTPALRLADAPGAPLEGIAWLAPRPARRSTLVVQQPVRSGQRIHAEGADLVVLGPVSIGAEISADGCIHVHGTLRGAAFAGADGDTGARIFAKIFDPTRVSIAGLWLGAEDLDPAWCGAAAHLRILGGRLHFEPLP
jgi:septum site-determining protein MinC